MDEFTNEEIDTFNSEVDTIEYEASMTISTQKGKLFSQTIRHGMSKTVNPDFELEKQKHFLRLHVHKYLDYAYERIKNKRIDND